MLKYVLVPLALVVIAFGGYNTYRYIKFNPPSWLIHLVASSGTPAPALPAGEAAPFKAPKGFAVTIFARDIPGARVITRDNKGTILVSQTQAGKVVALPDKDGDHQADKTVEILSGLNGPHGIVVWCSPLDSDRCLLFVAEENALKQYVYDAENLKATFVKKSLDLPSGGGHSTRSLLIDPDGEHLLISIGSSCNVCRESNPARASVLRYDIATGEALPYATGLRNTVFMALDPVDGKVWGTDMGRVIGDDIPPDEVNVLQRGKDYGWPICYSKNIHDTDFDHSQYIRDPCADKVPPRIELQAHSAPLGLAFIPEEGWPEGWGNDILVAYHGSWNRSTPTGYKVVRFNIDSKRLGGGEPIDFLTGFLPAGGKGANDALGRPVGLMAEPGGTVYVTDDRAGAVYRVALKEGV